VNKTYSYLYFVTDKTIRQSFSPSINDWLNVPFTYDLPARNANNLNVKDRPFIPVRPCTIFEAFCGPEWHWPAALSEPFKLVVSSIISEEEGRLKSTYPTTFGYDPVHDNMSVICIHLVRMFGGFMSNLVFEDQQ